MTLLSYSAVYCLPIENIILPAIPRLFMTRHEQFSLLYFSWSVGESNQLQWLRESARENLVKLAAKVPYGLNTAHSPRDSCHGCCGFCITIQPKEILLFASWPACVPPALWYHSTIVFSIIILPQTQPYFPELHEQLWRIAILLSKVQITRPLFSVSGIGINGKEHGAF